MTKQHFRALAQHLATTMPLYEGLEMEQWKNDVTVVAQVCEQFNPRFDRTRFMEHAVAAAHLRAVELAERE